MPGLIWNCSGNARALDLTRILPQLDAAEARGLLIRDHRLATPTPLGRRFLNDLIALFLD